MNAAQLHRGPDGEGIKLCKGSLPSVGLGHRRLSIIDIDGGHQPMSNEDETVWITYNGEIYNHLELHQELKRLGHRFSSRSDTEAIVHSYEEWGTECVHHLRGMFSFVIWDEKKRSLFAARDRLGIKPFYYSASENTLICASESKALLASGWVQPELNRSVIPELMTFGYIAGDGTLLSGVHKLLPGHWMTWSEGKLEVRQYWDVPVPILAAERSESDYIDEFRHLFDDSVRMRLMSDVPLGVFLSGGLDSSAIAATMAKEVSQPIKTFSVGYSVEYYSECRFAREVAKSIGAEHHEVLMQPHDLFRRLPELIWHEDAPVRTPSSVALFHVAQLASEHVKVVLTGEGSDELFAGYSRYWASLFNMRWGRVYSKMLPSVVRDRLIKRSLWKWPLPTSIKQKLSHTFLNHSLKPEELIFDNFLSVFPRRVHAQLFTHDMMASVEGINPYKDTLALYNGRNNENPLDKLLYTDQKTYLVELLKKQDKMSMAASIESRVPFLDHKIVEFAAHAPRHIKLRGRSEKEIVKKAFDGLLPKSVLTREKMGFPVPTKQWLRSGYDQVVEKILLDPRTVERGIFRPSFLKQSLQENRHGIRDRTDQLWTAMNLELWSRIFLDGEDFQATGNEFSGQLDSISAPTMKA